MALVRLLLRGMGATVACRRWRWPPTPPPPPPPRARSFATLSPPSKAVVFDQHGPPERVTRVIDLPPVELQENDVCVKMLAAPINPSDINRIQGTYPITPPLPAVGGYEGVGEVYALGSAVRSLSVGDWVIPSPPSFGTWQSYIVKEEGVWHKVRKDIPVEYAATAIVNPLTALLMLKKFVKLNSGDTIVQNGATSIVGQCIVQLARIQGIRSINIIRDRVGAEEVRVKLKKLGADEVYIESHMEPKDRSISGIVPEAALGFNCIGGNAASLVLKLLRPGGTMVTYGGMSKKPVTVSTSSFIFREFTLKGFWLQKWMSSEKAADCRVMIDYLLSLVQSGELKYEMELVSLDDFKTALDKALGKLGSHPKQVLRF